MSKYSRFRSLSSAAIEAFEKRNVIESRPKGRATFFWLFLKDSASVLSAIALALIGYWTLDINRRVYELNKQSDTEKAALISEIESLKMERDRVFAEIKLSERELVGALYRVTDAQSAVENERQQQRILLSENSAQRAENERMSAVLNRIEQERISAEQDAVRKSFSGVLRASTYGPDSYGRGLSVYDLVGFDGKVKISGPLPINNPSSASEIWAAVVEEARRWLAQLESDEREYASALVSEFIDNCAPIRSPQIFEFSGELPEWKYFQTTLDLAIRDGERMSMSEYEERKRKIEEASVLGKEQLQAAEQFAAAFNSARAEFIKAIQNEMFLCESSPIASEWAARSRDQYDEWIYMGTWLRDMTFGDPNNRGEARVDPEKQD